LLLITLWWVIPLFILELLTFPFFPYFKSHLLYLVTIAIAILFAVVLGFADSKWNLWKKYDYWGRYSLVLGTYTIQMLVLLFVFGMLSHWNSLEYYGSCPAGSVGMLFLPSIPVYFLLGVILGLVKESAKRKRMRGQQ
jgi:putative flippase GtrA